jgi:hypothetical protein
MNSAWTSDELSAIGAADELEIATRRGDGTLRRPVTIWVVRYGDELYVRSVNGRGAAWFRGALDSNAARIQAGGIIKDVGLVETSDLDEAIGAAYRAKYRRYARNIVESVLTPQARAATLRLEPVA